MHNYVQALVSLYKKEVQGKERFPQLLQLVEKFIQPIILRLLASI